MVLNDLNTTNVELLDDLKTLEENNYLIKEKELIEIGKDLDNRVLAVASFDIYMDSFYVIDNDLITHLSSLIPDEMYFSSWDFSGNIINMSGYSYDRSVIAEYESKLRDAGYNNIFIGSIIESTETGISQYQFTIYLMVGGTENEDE
jgi:hypothetical protein